jgi:DNA-binding transcriptional regulator YiaG
VRLCLRCRPTTLTHKRALTAASPISESSGLFAGYLRTNVRTLENWAQGRAKS